MKGLGRAVSGFGEGDIGPKQCAKEANEGLETGISGRGLFFKGETNGPHVERRVKKKFGELEAPDEYHDIST